MDKYKKTDNIFILSGIFAVFLYILLLLSIYILFNISKKKVVISISTPSEISAISVNIINDNSNTSNKTNKENKPTADEKQTSDKKNNEDSISSNTPVAGLGLGDLFNKIDAKEPIKEIEQKDNRDQVAVNKNAISSANEKINQILQKTQNVMKTLDNINQNITISDSNSSQFCEKYSDYCKEITEILYKNWDTKSSFDDKLSSKVVIAINKDGNFSYTIKQKSGNDIFDEELAESLQNLSKTKFPILKDVNIDNLEIIFRNKGE